MRKLQRDFYDRDTQQVAQDLLGKYLIRISDGVERIAKIVEVEAYLGPHDLAAHSARGRTPRTEVMFGPPGYAYVYMIYGMYFCMNMVTESEGHASAVLLRAVEPIQNITDKTKGPGLLCRAMQIDKKLNGHDLLSEDFFICSPPKKQSFEIIARPRIGIDYAKEWVEKPLRFYISGNSFISKK
jgi:DNA-3-methyladenine glycosylase